jgi:hypothetical protein
MSALKTIITDLFIISRSTKAKSKRLFAELINCSNFEIYLTLYEHT